MVKIGAKMGTCASLPHAKFGKNRLRRYTLWGKFTPEIIETLGLIHASYAFSLLWALLHIDSQEGATTLFHNADLIT